MSSELYQQVDPEDVGVSSAYLRNIDTLQERYLAENAYQGSVVLVARHGKVCYFKAFGKADEGVPMATDSIFRLMSMVEGRRGGVRHAAVRAGPDRAARADL